MINRANPTIQFLNRNRFGALLAATIAASAACSSGPVEPPDDTTVQPSKPLPVAEDRNEGVADPKDPQKVNPQLAKDSNVLAGLPTGADQLAVLCKRGNQDKVSKAVCAPGAKFTSLQQFQQLIGLSFPKTDAAALNGDGGNAAFALLSHSTSLVTRTVSAANPRAFVMSAPKGWKPSASVGLDPATGMTPPNSWEPRHVAGDKQFSKDQEGWVSPGTPRAQMSPAAGGLPGWNPPQLPGAGGAEPNFGSWPPGPRTPGACGAWGGDCTPPMGPEQPTGLTFGNGSGPDPNFVITAFTRGETLLEAAAFDAGANKVRFFLISFKVPCGAKKVPASSGFGVADETCTPGDLFTPGVEKNWTDITIHEDTDLENTMVACSSCHSVPGPNGAGKKNTLLLQEMSDPWTHWMSPWTAGGQAVLKDFNNVHSATGVKETYGGIPGELINKSEPRTIELLVRENGFTATAGIKPFDSRNVEIDIRNTAAGQPIDNSKPGSSDDWSTMFNDTTAKGRGAAAPDPNVKVMAPGQFTAVSQSYKGAMMSGDYTKLVSFDGLTTFANPERSGITISDSASPEQTLAQACAACHNGDTSTAATKSKFNLSIFGTLNREEKDRAIVRMRLPMDDRRHMPFEKTRHLSDVNREKIIGLLSK
jgi:hypothetical protein